MKYSSDHESRGRGTTQLKINCTPSQFEKLQSLMNQNQINLSEMILTFRIDKAIQYK